MGRVQVYSGCGTEARVVRCKGTGSTTGGTIQEHRWSQTCTPPYPQARTPQKKNTKTTNFGKLVVLYLICLCFFSGCGFVGTAGYGFSVSKYGNSAAGSPTNLAMVMARHGEDLLAMLNR